MVVVQCIAWLVLFMITVEQINKSDKIYNESQEIIHINNSVGNVTEMKKGTITGRY